jgi:hypothetical protein
MATLKIVHVVSDPMAWLVLLAEERCERMTQGRLFARLSSATRIEDISFFLDQLDHFSPLFISALFLRAANCNDPQFADIARQHAHEEGLHPDQYARWRAAHGLKNRSRPTRATLELAAMCTYSAMHETPAEQTVRLNLGAEIVALKTFSATLEAFDRMGVDNWPGQFWRKHREIDGQHMRLGLDRMPQAEEGSPAGQIYLEILMHTLEMFDRMLESWAG